MDRDAPHLALARLRAAWDAEVRPSARRALTALAVLGVLAAAHIGRVGTLPARAAAAAGVGLLVVLFAARAIVLHLRRGDARRTIRETIGAADPELAASAIRALRLRERAGADENVGSPALAALHLERQLARAPHERIRERAARAGGRRAALGLALAGAAVAAIAIEPLRVVEGLDVLAARDGVAPLPLAWIEDADVVAAPPEYLHQGREVLVPFVPTLMPRGTTIELRGRPLHAGRALVLTDGRAEVPFTDDGAGGVVARWTLGESATLAVAARFGGVLIRQADEQHVGSIPDEVPRVALEGAPRTVRLLDEPSVALRYEASDDHGLREVSLVLRAGPREERRVLSRPPGDARVDRGGYELRSRDAFFRRVYVPVEVRIEARDNDPITGPKWGKSEPFILVPPQVGEPEALRYAALLRARDALTDLLADRMAQPAPDAASAAKHVKDEAAAQQKAVDVIQEALAGDYGGLRVRGRAVTLARGQLARLTKALAAERKSTTRASHDALLADTEGALLALDAGVRALGFRDSQAVAKRLADVADEAADACAAIAGGDGSAPGQRADSSGPARLDASVLVLDGGGKQLLRLGELGLDLGEIVANGLRRIGRARAAEDWRHAELAARDLAARLRKPDPSFMGGGGGGTGGGQGGVEAGGPGSPQPGEASEADEEAASMAKELEELAREHAAEVGSVEEALDQASSPEELKELQDEAKRRAEAVREAVRDLPRSDAPRSTAEGSAAGGREQAESMAGALEQGDLREAVKSGQEAARSLQEAQRRGQEAGGFFPEERAGRRAGEALGKLQQELAWAEEALRKLRKAQSERARERLERSGERESALAERARELQRKGEQGESRLPEEALERLAEAEQRMRDAEQALREGDGERGLERQREAQRLLEMSQEPQDDGQQEGPRESADGKEMAQDADVPGKDKHKTPEEFRKRVLEGLGRPGDPRLKDAVRRYAEGLLK